MTLDYIRQLAKASGTSIEKFITLIHQTLLEGNTELNDAISRKDIDRTAFLLHKNKASLRSMGMSNLNQNIERFEQHIEQHASMDEIHDELRSLTQNQLASILHSLEHIKNVYQQYD